MKMRIATAGVLAVAGVAHAAIDAETAIQSPLPGTLEVLELSDGSWDKGLNATLATAQPGEDFGFPIDFGGVMWMRENWIGGVGSTAGFATSFDTVDTGNGGSVTFPITILKEVTNNAGFFADRFVIELTETGGSSIAGVFANPNAAFDTVSIVTAGPTTTITFDIGAGSGLSASDTVVFDFGFDVSGSISFNIEQTLIPTPGVVTLLGLSAVGVVARRRRS